MQRKPGFPVANCSIKMPDSMPVIEGVIEEEEPLQRRQQLINFGHTQWGFNNWSWSVTKQDLDFVDLSNGKYTAGVVAFVSVTLKTLDIHRENIGYATSLAPNKGAAIYRARKCAVTNALRETLLSFGGNIATELTELLESHRPEQPAPEPPKENNPNITNNLANNLANHPANSHANVKHDAKENNPNIANHPVNPPNNFANIPKHEPKNICPRREPPVKNVPPPVARAHPMPAPANAPRPPPPAPQRNEVKLEGMSEEEARAERKRRQKQAQEEFRLKHLVKNDLDDKQESNKTSSIDTLLMGIQTQDIVIEETGNTEGKRKSPAPDSGNKRLSVLNKLVVYET